MISKNYVLRPTEDLEKLVCDIDNVCIAINDVLGFVAFGYTTAEDKGNVRYHYWTEQLKDLGWIRLVEDFEIPITYIEVSLPTLDLHDQILLILKEKLPILSAGDLKAFVLDAMELDTKSQALAWLGIGSQGEYDSEVKNLLVQGLISQKVNVRNAATMSIFLLKWSEFRAPLEECIIKEEDLDLRAKMAYALSFCVKTTQ